PTAHRPLLTFPTRRSSDLDGNGIPLGCVAAPANRNDSLLLRPTLEKLSRFGFHLPEQITVHLDAGYDSAKTRGLLTELGCDWEISSHGDTLQAGTGLGVEDTHN